ncbi:MAG: hypothetical protein F7C36_00875 [Desulfurococcales archaeon]|nr:hypothetical protein [Desulfurococcales archaeon]
MVNTRIILSATILLLLVIMGSIHVNAQTTTTLPITAEPEAPEPVQNLASKALGLAMYVLIVVGLLALLVGGAKFAMGAPDAGKWIIRGAIALVIGIGFWAIVTWLL